LGDGLAKSKCDFWTKLLTKVNHLVFLMQISRLRIHKETGIAPLRIQKIGITITLIQFGQFPVDFVSVEVLRPKVPEPSRHLVLPDILAGQ